MTNQTKMTAEEYKASLPKGSGGTAYTMETFSVYVNLLYPHITVVPGQEWTGTLSKYRFHCAIHGVFPQLVIAGTMLTASRGCNCRGCKSDASTQSAGKVRKPRATQAERDKAKELHATGMSYADVARELGRSPATIRTWIDPKAHEDSINYNKEWAQNNIEKARVNKKRYRQFDHGRAMFNAMSAKRRALEHNAIFHIEDDDGKLIKVDMWNNGLKNNPDEYHLFVDLEATEKYAELHVACKRYKELTGEEWQVDHLIPLSIGGQEEAANFACRLKSVNLKKGNKLTELDTAVYCSRLFGYPLPDKYHALRGV